MLQVYKKRTNIGVGLGLLLQLVGNVCLGPEGAEPSVNLSIVGMALGLAGFVLFIWGCLSYSKGKGYHPGWGFLGLLSFFGLIILVLMPDRHKKNANGEDENSAP